MGRFVVWQPNAGQKEPDGAKVSARDARAAVEEWAAHDDRSSNEFVEPRDLPAYPLALGEAPRVLFNKRGLRAGMPGFRTECTREEREHTPPAMADWLVAVARKAHNFGGEAQTTAAPT